MGEQLNRYYEMTFDEIGAELGVTRQCVEQICEAALIKLKNRIEYENRTGDREHFHSRIVTASLTRLCDAFAEVSGMTVNSMLILGLVLEKVADLTGVALDELTELYSAGIESMKARFK